jgi:hypothetical protein
MRGGINQNLVRAMFASLLNSELSLNEIRRFAQDLDDPENVRQLQKAIFHLAEALRQPDSRHELRSDGEASSLLDFIQRKRLSKAQVRDRMMSIAPTLFFERDGDTRTMRELVQLFTQTGSNRANQFMKTVGGEGPDDPYLKGIIDRDKK